VSNRSKLLAVVALLALFALVWHFAGASRRATSETAAASSSSSGGEGASLGTRVTSERDGGRSYPRAVQSSRGARSDEARRDA
jgi:hypothetical protein